MRTELLDYLSDPIDSSSFEITSFEENSGHVISGLLTSKSNWYPIIGGIPRILIGELKDNLLQSRHEFFKEYKDRLPEAIQNEWQKTIEAIPDFDAFLRHQKKTAESFSYEWKNIYRENDFEKQNFLHFLSPFVTEKDLAGKKTLDIGCGSGRFTKWAALSGTQVSFGTDLGESVEVAYEMTKDIPNICIVQADIYAMPFKNVFDLSYSIGVLHHLPKPKQGFSRLPATLVSGGNMLIWVYNRRNNARALYFYEPLRSLLKKLPKPLLFKLCYIPGFAIHLINMVTVLLKTVGLKKLADKVPFSYYANFPFNMKLNDAFDVLATPKSNYYFKEEIEQWFADANLSNVHAFEHPEAGITCIGTYGA
ncbi:MAG: methyltransferase domain-containing protein [Patescibacteria group bacterium]